jgi:arylsulfatase A-like enzyme
MALTIRDTRRGAGCRALLAAALLAAACGGEAPPAEPIRLLEGAEVTVRWPDPSAAPPAAGEPVEIGFVAPPGRIGRVVMHLPGDGRDARVALLAPAGGGYRTSVALPRRDPVLALGLGYLLESAAPGLPMRFRVVVHPGRGEPVAVLDETIVTAADGGWSDREVPLDRWAGERVELELLTEAAAGASPWGAWAAPEIVGGGRREDGWNVVLVVLDTLRADRLGSYGYQRPTSPWLDELAGSSFRFATVISQSSWTRPSIRSMLCGLYPQSRGGLTSPPIAEVLWAHGWRTQASTGGAQLAYQFGFSRGFERHALERWVRATDRVVATLEANRGRRHFLFLHTYEIHDPYEHRELAAGMDPGRVGEVFRRKTLERIGREPAPAERAYIEALYDSGIRYTDEQLGRLLATLDERGLLERTLLIVTSDHGEEFWEHGSWGHGRAMFDHQSRVPLIVRVPEGMREALGLAEGPRVVRQQVRLVDLYPTILDLLGVPLDHRVQGRSLRPLLEGRRLPAADAFSESTYWGPIEVKALRSERFKYLRGAPKRPDETDREGWEALYDLAEDPAESADVRQEHPPVLGRMRTLVDRIVAGGSVAAEERLPEDADPELIEQLRSLGYID